MLPGPGADKRVCQLASESTYAELVDGGVEVWNFQPSMLHAKIMTVDEELSVIGSSNFNRRSMDHDEEIALAILDRDVTATLDLHFDDDLKSQPTDRPGALAGPRSGAAHARVGGAADPALAVSASLLDGDSAEHLVVGGGISGIACAAALRDAGRPVVVRDRGHRLGGRMAVRTVDGRPIDVGAAYFTVTASAVPRGRRAMGSTSSWCARGPTRSMSVHPTG